MSGETVRQRNQDATVYVGNLDSAGTEELLCELFLQVGPVVNVFIPRDKVTATHMGYGFVEFSSEEDAEYAQRVMNMLKLFGKNIKVNKSSTDRKLVDIGANIFIGNLDPMIDEKMLHDTFSAFGTVVTGPRIQRDEESNDGRGCGFIGFDSFESADLCIQSMNGQFFGNRQIRVSYAFKKGSKHGERHGTDAERLLAKEHMKHQQEFFNQGIMNTTSSGTANIVPQAPYSYGIHPHTPWMMTAPPMPSALPMMMIPPSVPYPPQPPSMYTVPPPLNPPLPPQHQ